MTSASERTAAARHGLKMADSAIQSRLKAMDRLGLDYVYDGEFTAVVDGAFEYNLAAATWCEFDVEGDRQHGYTLIGLHQAVERRHVRLQEMSAEARDSAGIAPSLNSTGIDPDTRAEVSAGVPSSSLLPEVAL